jgi:Tfp pilus assembly protein PilN
VAASLVPESLVRTRQRAILRQRAIKAAVLACAIFVALSAWFFQCVAQRSAYTRELESRLAAIRPRAESVMAKQRQLAAIQRQLDRKGSALELLARLCEQAPDAGLNITRFSYARGKSITVEGRAQSMIEVNLLAENLRQSGKKEVPEFERAVTASSRQEYEWGQPVIHYEILIPFPQEAPSDEEEQPVE